MVHYFRFFSLSLLFLLIIGCVKNRPFQTGKIQPIGPPEIQDHSEPNGTEPEPASLESKVGIIEFDDMGELWERCSLEPAAGHCQLRDVLQWVQQERDEAERDQQQPVTLVFVHGWHHNANPQDENLQEFQRKVQTLQEMSNRVRARCIGHENEPQCSTTFSKRNIRFIGVYIGWRARTLKAPKKPAWLDPDYLAFFDRESTAMRTSLVSLSETMLRLRQASERKNGSYASRFIVIGHSFGGLMVERSFVELLTESIVGADHSSVSCADGSLGARPLADMVVLLNPAADAILTEQTIDMLKRSRVATCPLAAPGSAAQGVRPPLILSLTASGDTATGKWFPRGHWVGQIDKTFRSYPQCQLCGPTPPKQGTLYRHTAGHLPYVHNFCYLDNSGTTGDPVCDAEARFLNGSSAGGERRNAYKQQLRAFSGIDSSASTLIGADVGIRHFYHRCAVLNETLECNQNWNDTPYWILSVPKSISSSHDDIWRNSLSWFIQDVIDATTPVDPLGHTAIQ